MNTTPNANFSLSAKYLGPVFSLTANLTRNAQNMIYARNGTGKSFLSRAFRYLDLHGQENDIGKAAYYLVSDESSDGRGHFEFSCGSQTMGMLRLEKIGNKVSADLSDTIFHVFSDDFVQDELRERSYEINGEIENTISVDSENISLQDALMSLDAAQEQERLLSESLFKLFATSQREELTIKAKINRRLREYKEINFESQVLSIEDKPISSERTFIQILEDLNRLKTLPSDPLFPEETSLLALEQLDFPALIASLTRATSLSSVADEIKGKIELDHDFYETGTKIVQAKRLSICPFCDQDITRHGPHSIIDSYISYFADEEETHKNELKTFYRILIGIEEEIREFTGHIGRQKTKYERLKQFIPSKQNSEVDDCEKEIEVVGNAISVIKDTLTQKADDLSEAYSIQDGNLLENIEIINGIIKHNNSQIMELNISVIKADEERKTLQREACTVFVREFTLQYWNDVCQIKRARNAVEERKDAVLTLKKSSPSARARDRVAETFELLIQSFFAGKYIFDKEKFTLRRGDREMARGPHRTLSDGEKTAIAFCYFVASMHRKVKTSSDYHRLFLVFDDPVTSMSYDYVFAIAETLKNLNVSIQGDVSVNPGVIDGNTRVRPKLLILTHSSYFFNIAITNTVVRPDAAFALYAERDVHRISPMNKYLAPFQQQIRHIVEVAEGGEPDHGTGNAVRSVLEAVGRFCRPDKCVSLSTFVQFLATEGRFKLRSVLINSLSHGTYYQETPAPDDLRLACKETLNVVSEYAIGQIEVIRASGGA